MSENKVSLHRMIKTSPAKIYRAFTEPLALASWLPPYGFVARVELFEAKADGKYRMSFQNFSTGKNQGWSGTFSEFKPNELLKFVEEFDDPNLPGKMTTTIWLQKTSVGTDLKILQEGIPDAIPADGCYLGWQDSLEKLIKLVEPEIPDE